MNKRYAIIGSREFTNDHKFRAAIREYKENIRLIVSGGAKGADTLAENYAKAFCIPYLIFPANWDKYGKRAGFVRNEKIIECAEIVIAFWDMKSKGTAHSIAIAEDKGLEVIVIDYTKL